MVTVQEMISYSNQINPYHWDIRYKGAKCAFESPDENTAIISHLEVPTELRNKNIGTLMIQSAEKIIKQETDCTMLYATIGTSKGATKHVLENKCGFEVTDKQKRDMVGNFLKAEKEI